MQAQQHMQLNFVYVTFTHGQQYCSEQRSLIIKNNNILKEKIDLTFSEVAEKYVN